VSRDVLQRNIADMASSPDFDALIRALNDEGVKTDGLTLGDSAGSGHSLSVREACDVGSELLRMPLKCCLTSRPVDVPKKMRPIMEEASSTKGGGGNFCLCVRLWCEKLSPSSPVFSAWIALLERRIDVKSSALRWDDDTVARCGVLSQVPNLLAEARSQVAGLRDRLRKLTEMFPSKLTREPSDDEIAWLFLVCSSGALPLQIGEGDESHRTVMLIIAPVVDFVSHTCTEGPAFLEVTADDAVVMRSPCALRPGDQVVCNYFQGASNDALVVDAGFALLDNPCHQVVLALSFENLRPGQAQAMKRLQLDRFLRSAGPGRTAVSIVMRKSDPFPNVAVVLSRILTHSEDSEALQLNPSSDTADMDSRWMPKLLEVLKAHLANYPVRLEAEHPADIVYCSTREVLKLAVARLLAFTLAVKAPPSE